MSRRLARRVSGFFIAAAIALVAAPAPSAHADTAKTGPSYFGWWYKLNTAPIGSSAPLPPDTPPGGLYLAADPTGPAAVSALHFNGTGAGDATLTLAAATGSTYTPATILACPVSSTWNPATGGGWDVQPKADCAKAGGGVKGVADGSGASMSWKLGPAFQPDAASYDVVLLPQGPVPFRVAVPLPDANTLDAPVAPAIAPEPEPEAPPVEAPVPAPVDVGSSVGSSPSPVATLPTPARRRPAPRVAAGSVGATNARALKAPDSRMQRMMAAMALALLGAALWWFGGAEQRGPRLLGSLGGGSGPEAGAAPAPALVVGGIGRFARPRVGRPQPLT